MPHVRWGNLVYSQVTPGSARPVLSALLRLKAPVESAVRRNLAAAAHKLARDCRTREDLCNDRRHRVQILTLTCLPSRNSDSLWTFAKKRVLVWRLEWLTLLPDIPALRQSSHLMASLPSPHGDRLRSWPALSFQGGATETDAILSRFEHSTIQVTILPADGTTTAAVSEPGPLRCQTDPYPPHRKRFIPLPGRFPRRRGR